MKSILTACHLSREQLRHLLRDEQKGRNRKLMVQLLESRISQAPVQLNENKDLATDKPEGQLAQQLELQRIEGYKRGGLKAAELKAKRLIAELDKSNQRMSGPSMTHASIDIPAVPKTQNLISSKRQHR